MKRKGTTESSSRSNKRCKTQRASKKRRRSVDLLVRDEPCAKRTGEVQRQLPTNLMVGLEGLLQNYYDPDQTSLQDLEYLKDYYYY